MESVACLRAYVWATGIHERTTGREIVEAFRGERLDYWVTGYGTGGTLLGVSRVLKRESPNTKV